MYVDRQTSYIFLKQRFAVNLKEFCNITTKHLLAYFTFQSEICTHVCILLKYFLTTIDICVPKYIFKVYLK